MNETPVELQGMNINELSIKFKDLFARESIQEIINAITSNNNAIVERINNLNSRLVAIESSIGKIPNKVEAQPAVYYTSEEAAAYNTEHQLNEGDEGYVTTETIKTPAQQAVPYTIMQIIEDNEMVVASALNNINNRLSNLEVNNN